MEKKPSVYEIVTAKIIAELEKGVAPWQKPWKGTGSANAPKNLKSGTPYSGVNSIILGMCSPYTSPYWATYNQIRDMHGYVRKGEKGTAVVFWKPLKIKEKGKAGEESEKTIPYLRYYTVFNLEQAEDVRMPKHAQPGPKLVVPPIEAAEKVVAEMPNRPHISYGNERAYYVPSEDRIAMPHREAFVTPEAFYGTLFHELAHSTGHKSRTGRIKDWGGFGSEPYAQEELVAEIASAFVQAETGIFTAPEEANTAAYAANWLKALKNDRTMIVKAASQAQKAANWIMNRTAAVEATEEEKEAA